MWRFSRSVLLQSIVKFGKLTTFSHLHTIPRVTKQESCHACLKRKLKINLLKEIDGMRLFAYHDSLSVTTFRL